MQEGKFVVIEGIDGSGKSSLVKGVAAALTARGLNVTTDFEPTKESPFADEILGLLRQKGEGEKLEEVNERLLGLFTSDRKWHLKEKIKPRLEKRGLLIQDRYYYSTAAYQGATPEGSLQIIEENLRDPEILQPDLILYIKLREEVALQRLQGRGKALEIFETGERLRRIGANYEAIFNHIELPSLVVEIEGELDEGSVCEKALAALNEHILRQPM